MGLDYTFSLLMENNNICFVMFSDQVCIDRELLPVLDLALLDEKERLKQTVLWIYISTRTLTENKP